MSSRFNKCRCLAVLFGLLPFVPALAGPTSFRWTILTPEKDSRDADEQSYDDFDTGTLIAGMNQTEPIFHQRLTCDKTTISRLLSSGTPFCHFHFDAVKPLILSAAEKEILREYFRRGGFILFQEDCYPYDQWETWQVKSWPIVDFLTRELPASSPDFKTTRITDDHAIFNQVYHTETSEATRHELLGNPHTPNRTLVTYRGHPCAFVYGRYYLRDGDGDWTAMPRPFPHVFSLDPRGYKLTVNIYVYAATH